jgi:hypothetical protein
VIRNITDKSDKKEFNIKILQTTEGLIKYDNNPKLVVNALNNHFCSVGEKIVNKLGKPSKRYKTEKSVTNSLFLTPITEQEISDYINQLNSKTASGIDEISATILKNTKQYILKPLQHIFNVSIETGIFPDKYKIAKIKPIYKKGIRTDPNNYRPISLLSNCSKLLEKCIKKRLVTFLEQTCFFSDNQYGFRAGRSTSDAIYNLTEIICKEIDNNCKVITIFLDLAKAFDTISHNILLSKMENCGIRGLTLSWFKSYLTNRKQAVQIENNVSDYSCIQYGVPQGTVLGPILFLIYINDLCNLKLTGNIQSFADDTTITISGVTWKETFYKAEIELKKVSNWLHENLLVLNTDKTRYMTFSPTIIGQPTNNIKIKYHKCVSMINCDCKELVQEKQITHLGVIIDQHLKWNIHIQHVIKLLRKLSYKFLQLRNIVDIKTLRMVYHALVQSILIYGIISWGAAYETNLKPLIVQQNNILRICTNKTYETRVDSLYKEFSVLTLPKLYIKAVLIYYKKNENKWKKIQHAYKTRSKMKLNLEYIRTNKEIARCHSSIMAPKIYNNMPMYIKSERNLNRFKKLISKWIQSITKEQLEAIFG